MQDTPNNENIIKMQNNIIIALTDILENRNKETSGHIERVIKYQKLLINAMKERGTYINDLKALDLNMLDFSARLYDIGKIFIPQAILNKHDKLSFNEFEIIKTHALEGERIIDQIASRTEADPEFLRYAKLYAGYHHERWDGKGYPRRLDRLNIPIQGRIMAIIDVYDALVSERPYKKPFTPEEAVKIIMDSTGEMFDPLIADVFFDIKEKFFTT